MDKFTIITDKGQSIGGCRKGEGKHHLVAFHGFGQSAEVLCAQLGFAAEHRTIWCFHLPFHGGDEGFVSKDDYLQAIHTHLINAGVEHYDVFGFSIGARVAMELIADDKQKLFLVAPDGLARRWLFEFLTGTFVGKQLFKFVACKRLGAVMFMSILTLFEWLLPGIPLRKLWSSKRWRELLYDRWVTLGAFSVSEKRAYKKVSLHLEWMLLAKHDVLIDNNSLTKLCKKYNWSYVFAPVHHDVISIQLSRFVSANSFDLRITSSSAQEARE